MTLRHLSKMFRHYLGLCPKAIGGYTCRGQGDYYECG